MPAHLSRYISAAVATLFFATAGTAHAQGKSQGKGHDKGHDKSHTEAVRDDHHADNHEVLREAQRRQNDPRYEQRDGDHRNDPRYDGRQNARRIPPGLAKKPGGMPPGQYKKMYRAHDGAGVLRDVLDRRGYTVVRSADAGESEYVYYRLRDGSVRRAVVSPGAERLRFSNVPNSLLSEVLARLY
jgi:hypothetical protein